MKLIITIDNDDAALAPTAPYTLMATLDGEAVDFSQEGDSLIGDDVRKMLRHAAHTLRVDFP